MPEKNPDPKTSRSVSRNRTQRGIAGIARGSAGRLYLARFISRTGSEAAFFVGVWGKAAFEFDATPGGLAVLMICLGLAALVGSALAGVLIDRHGPKRVLVVSEIFFVPVAISGAFTQTLPQLTVVATLIGLVVAPGLTAIASLPPYLTDDPQRLARFNAGVETAGMAALISGTAVGAVLASLVSLDSIFWFDAVTSVVAVLLVLPVSTRTGSADPVHQRDGNSWVELAAGFRHVYADRRLRFFVLAGTSLWLVFGLFSGLEPLFFRDVLGEGPAMIGWVNTMFGVGLVVGTFMARVLSEERRGGRAVAVLMILNGVGAVYYVSTTSLAVVMSGALIWGVLIGTFAPTVRTQIHLNSPPELVGRVMGTTQAHGESAKLLPLIAAPLMVAVFGVQPSLVLAGVVLAVLGLLAWRTGAGLDREDRNQSAGSRAGRSSDVLVGASANSGPAVSSAGAGGR